MRHSKRSLLDALTEARTQEKLDPELKAAVGLYALTNEPADRETLAATYAKVTAGFDVKICVRARELLGVRTE